MNQVTQLHAGNKHTQIVGVSDIFTNPELMARMERFAELMASGRSTVPDHLMGNVGDCMAVTLQAAQWGMNPFSVAQKTHTVKGVLGYEAQLVNAVITSMAPTKGRLNFEWFGDWKKVVGKFKIMQGDKGEYRVPDWKMADEEGLGIKVFATIKGESEPRVLELLLSQARTRNSTMWADDPKQQLAYLAIKKWARLNTPDVIMGVYTPDELDQIPAKEMGQAERVPERTTEPAALPHYPDDKFEANYGKWQQAIEEGKFNVDELMAKVGSAYQFTDKQKDQVEALRDAEPVEGGAA